MGCALSLIALAVGYLVLVQAAKEKEGLKLLGQIIGIIVLIAAFLSGVCSAMKCSKMGCPMKSGMGAMCPLSGADGK